MNAELVWQVWRRILREDALQAALFEPGFAARAAEFGLSGRELEVALEYARTPGPTRWAIETYRFRSFNVIVEALYVAAPLSARLLQRRGFDLDALARDYLASIGWRDQGPYTYGTCAGTLAWLGHELAGDRDRELAELIHFELVTIDLLRSLAGQQLTAPDAARLALVEQPDRRFQQTGQAVVFETRCDLTPWLRDPDLIGVQPLVEEQRTFLRYLRSSQEEPGLIALQERGRRSYELLAQPRSAAELSLLLGDPDPQSAQATLRRFSGLGVVAPAQEPCA